jgi:hypothetical protein
MNLRADLACPDRDEMAKHIQAVYKRHKSDVKEHHLNRLTNRAAVKIQTRFREKRMMWRAIATVFRAKKRFLGGSSAYGRRKSASGTSNASVPPNAAASQPASRTSSKTSVDSNSSNLKTKMRRI